MFVSFNALKEKVHQAESALEAKERQTGANWRQTKSAWRAAWTPGRIMIAGLVCGFAVGRAEPFKRAAGGGTLQLISALGSLFAGGGAQAAAEHAEDAAEGNAAGDAMARDPSPSPTPPSSTPSSPAQAASDAPPYELPEAFRDSGHL